jgi:hypothetical protein
VTFTEILILASFVIGLIPATLLFVSYARTRWYATETGKVLFSLFLVTALSYGLSVVVLALPDVFHDSGGEWFRIISRTIIAGVLWNMYRLFKKAQRSAVIPPENTDALDGLETARVFIDSDSPDQFRSTVKDENRDE